jgi:hypothetical protein
MSKNNTFYFISVLFAAALPIPKTSRISRLWSGLLAPELTPGPPCSLGKYPNFAVNQLFFNIAFVKQVGVTHPK